MPCCNWFDQVSQWEKKFQLPNKSTLVTYSRDYFAMFCSIVTFQNQHPYRQGWRISPYRQKLGERGGSVVECRTPEREVRGSKPTAAVLCPWARHFTPRKYWLLTQEAMAPSRYDWKIVDWDVKPQHNQPTNRQKLEGILKKLLFWPLALSS